eukprot:3204037-Amphidinium_carterae.1
MRPAQRSRCYQQRVRVQESSPASARQAVNEAKRVVTDVTAQVLRASTQQRIGDRRGCLVDDSRHAGRGAVRTQNRTSARQRLEVIDASVLQSGRTLLPCHKVQGKGTTVEQHVQEFALGASLLCTHAYKTIASEEITSVSACTDTQLNAVQMIEASVVRIMNSVPSPRSGSKQSDLDTLSRIIRSSAYLAIVEEDERSFHVEREEGGSAADSSITVRRNLFATLAKDVCLSHLVRRHAFEVVLGAHQARFMGIECPICQDRFSEIDCLSLVLLPCQHVLCSDCVNALHERGHQTCPLCRQPVHARAMVNQFGMYLDEDIQACPRLCEVEDGFSTELDEEDLQGRLLFDWSRPQPTGVWLEIQVAVRSARQERRQTMSPTRAGEFMSPTSPKTLTSPGNRALLTSPRKGTRFCRSPTCWACRRFDMPLGT